MIGLVGGFGAAAFISFTNVLLALSYSHGATPATFLLVRYAMLLSGCIAWVVWRHESLALTRTQRLHAVGVGLANVVGATSLSFAIARIPVSLAILLLYSFPLITLLIEAMLDRRRPPFLTLACMSAAFCGLAMAVRVGADGVDPMGIVFGLLAACGIAVSFVWSNRRLTGMGNSSRLLHVAATGMIFSIAVGSGLFEVTSPVASFERAITLLLASLAFCAAYLFLFAGIERNGATATAMSMNLEPPLTAAIAFVLLGDTTNGGQLVGIVIVVGAVIVAQRTSTSGTS